MRKLVLTASGVARGDPPQGAIGIVLSDNQGKTLVQMGKTVGKAPKEVAEYKALLEGLRLALQYEPQELVVFVESQQLANQILGVLPPREPAMQHLTRQVQESLQQFPRWRISYVDEDVCRTARRLAEQALQQERQLERERHALCEEIHDLLDRLSVEDLRTVLNFLKSLHTAKG